MVHAMVSPPSPFIYQWVQHLKAVSGNGGDAIDVACGSGRHGRLLLEAGFAVAFCDRDIGGVADLRDKTGATIVEADLEQDGGWPLAGRQFDVVVVTNYLWRPNWHKLLQLVKPGGYLLYETFAAGNEVYGRPASPNFLLQNGELLAVTGQAFDILDYRQGYEERPSPSVKQKIAARRFSEPKFIHSANGFEVNDDPLRLDMDKIHAYLHAEAYWCKGIPRALMEASLRDSLCLGVYDKSDGRMLGFGRVVTDRATFAYLGDVFVDEAARGNGLSKMLMQAVSDHPDLQGLRRFMLATADAHGLYRQFGFKPIDNPQKFMEIARPDIYMA